MIVKQYQTGPFEVNTYALIDEKEKKVALIDVGGDIENIMTKLQKKGYSVEYILNTHGHFDHIFGEKEAQDLYGLNVYIHKDDEILLQNLDKQLAMWGGCQTVEPPKITGYLKDNDIIELGSLKIKVLHTPGHTPGGVGFLCENTLFSGDSLFYQTIGRTDLPYGNYDDLIKSVKEKFLTLPDNIKVLPGHGEETNIGYEKQYNEFLK